MLILLLILLLILMLLHSIAASASAGRPGIHPSATGRNLPGC